MSELQESQRPISAGAKTGAGPAPKPNPSVNTNPATVKSTSQGISGMNNTAARPVSTPTPTASAQPYTPVFTTDKIQHTKATRPKEYFDEQNRKNAEKKKRDTKNRRNIIIIGAAILGALALIGLIWFVVIKINQPANNPGTRTPIVTNGSDEEISKIREYLQDVYNSDGADKNNNGQDKLNAADEALNEILNEPGGEEYANQINLAKMLFYFDNGLYSNIVAIKDSIHIDSLQPEQQITYYNTLYVTYQSLQDYEKANEYFVLSYNLSKELGGAGGPDE